MTICHQTHGMELAKLDYENFFTGLKNVFNKKYWLHIEQQATDTFLLKEEKEFNGTGKNITWLEFHVN